MLLLESGKQADALKELLPEMVRLLWNAGLRVNSPVLTVAECLEAVERASVPGSACWTGRLLAGDRDGLREAGGQAAERLGIALPEDEPAPLRTGARAPCQVSEHAFPRGARRESGPRRLAGRAADRIGWRCSKREAKDEANELNQAAAFVSSARCFLHYRAGCDQNILDFETQESPALQAFARGKTASEWMREYFQSAHTIFNEARRAIAGGRKEPEFPAGELPRVTLTALQSGVHGLARAIAFAQPGATGERPDGGVPHARVHRPPRCHAGLGNGAEARSVA